MGVLLLCQLGKNDKTLFLLLCKMSPNDKTVFLLLCQMGNDIG
jgi:hypothetical protein